jgi:hypothetical protein
MPSICKRRRELLERVLGDDHELTLELMNDLGMTYCLEGRFEEAVELHTVTLATRERVLGEEHPDVLQTMYCLADDYFGQGRWEDAARLQDNVTCTMNAVLGDQHPSTVKAAEALKLTQDAINGKEKSKGLESAVLNEI